MKDLLDGRILRTWTMDNKFNTELLCYCILQYVYSLNDIPRSSHFSSEERHVDLRCWMAQGIRVLVRMSGLIDGN